MVAYYNFKSVLYNIIRAISGFSTLDFHLLIRHYGYLSFLYAMNKEVLEKIEEKQIDVDMNYYYRYYYYYHYIARRGCG